MDFEFLDYYDDVSKTYLLADTIFLILLSMLINTQYLELGEYNKISAKIILDEDNQPYLINGKFYISYDVYNKISRITKSKKTKKI